MTGEQHAGVLTVTWGETEVSRAVRGGGVRAGARARGPSGWPGEREIAASRAWVGERVTTLEAEEGF